MTQTVLVIEDESELCNILDDELTAQGYKVVLARNGQDGLDKIQEVTPDLIICDRAMPIMSGYQVFGTNSGGVAAIQLDPVHFSDGA
jgi:DNA-binding response OmpR family regulator